MVRRDDQAGDIRVGRGAIPPVDQLAGVAAGVAAIAETGGLRADQHTSVISLEAVRVNPGGHGHRVGVEIQGRDCNPGGGVVIAEAGGPDRGVGGFKSREGGRSRADDSVESVRRSRFIFPGKATHVVVRRRVGGGVGDFAEPPVCNWTPSQHVVRIAPWGRSRHDRETRRSARDGIAGGGRVRNDYCVAGSVARGDTADAQ